MWEDSRSIYIEVTTASPFKYFTTRFRATPLVHMGSEQQWRLNLKCSTAQAFHYNDYESLVNDIVEFFSLQKVSAWKYPEQCASASERLGLTASCTTKSESIRPASGARRFGRGGRRPKAGRFRRCEKDDKWRKRVDPSSVPTPPLP